MASAKFLLLVSLLIIACAFVAQTDAQYYYAPYAYYGYYPYYYGYYGYPYYGYAYYGKREAGFEPKPQQ